MTDAPQFALLPEREPVEDPTKDQMALFDKLPSYAEEHWKGMPPFEAKNIRPRFQLLVSFPSREARDEFAALIKQPISDSTRSLWFPPVPYMKLANRMYVGAEETKTAEENDSSGDC